MKAQFSILAILILLAFNCSAQTANPIKQKEQQKAGRKKITTVISSSATRATPITTSSTKGKTFKLENSTLVRDTLRRGITHLKKN